MYHLTNIPRPIMGLMRNKKENHGQTNKKFALKELTREMMTGPSMFIIPLTCLTFAKKKLAKSAEIPRLLIKSFGEIHASNAINKLGEAIDKETFYEKVFEEILKNAKGETEVSSATIEKAKELTQKLKEAISQNFVNIKNNYSAQTTSKLSAKLNKSLSKDKIQEIVYDIADITKQYSDDVAHTDFLQSTIKGTTASTKDIINFMQSYADDVVEKAKTRLTELKNNQFVEHYSQMLQSFIKEKVNKRIVGRVGLNILMYALVLGFLQLIPKFYNKAEGKGNAGLKGLVNEQTPSKSNSENKSNKAKPSFGKSTSKQPSFGSMQDIATKLTTNSGFKTKLLNAFEFEGCNVSFPLLLGIMGFGILLPRTRQAKDKYDKAEIIRRDSITCLIMCFGEKVVRKLVSAIYEKATGLVFARKPKNYTKFDYFRPINGVRLLNTEQVINSYSNIDKYKNGIEGFCDFIIQNKGHLNKLFKVDKTAQETVENLLISNGKNIETASNEEIKEILVKAQETEAIKSIIEKFKSPNNPWVSKIKTINAVTTAFVVCVFVPAILGFGLPAINSLKTKKKVKEENMLKEGMNRNYFNYNEFSKKDEKANNIFGDFIK